MSEYTRELLGEIDDLRKEIERLEAELENLRYEAKMITPDQNEMRCLKDRIKFLELTQSEQIKQLQTEIEHLKQKIDNQQGVISFRTHYLETERKTVKVLQAELAEAKVALREIIIESGKVDIDNWPVQQQICQSIAQQTLKEQNCDGTQATNEKT